MPSSSTRARVFAERAVVTISPRQPLRARGARDRAADQPEADQRDFLEQRRGAHLPRHEVAQAVDHQPVGFLGADGQAQRMRQAVIGQAAQHQAALGEERIGVGGGLALLLREMDQDEIRHARRHLEAELCHFIRQPAAPFLGVRLRHLDMRGVLDRRHRRQHRRGRDVERPADAVDRIDDIGRAEHPADPQRGEAVNLGERMRHHRVLGGRHQFDADLVIVARDVIGIGGVEHQQHMSGSPARSRLTSSNGI